MDGILFIAAKVILLYRVLVFVNKNANSSFKLNSRL